MTFSILVSGSSQNTNEIDSLFSIFDQQIESQNISDSLIYKIFDRSSRTRNLGRIKPYLSTLDSLKNSSKDSLFIYKVNYGMSKYYTFSGDYEKAIDLQTGYINYFLNQEPSQYPVDAYYYLGRLHKLSNNDNEAVYYLLRGKEHAQLKHRNWIPLIVNALGDLYQKFEYFDKAVSEYKYLLQEKELNVGYKMRAYISLADTYFKIDKIDSAEHYSQKLLDQEIGPRQIAFHHRANINLAKCAMLKGDCPKAIEIASPLSGFYDDHNLNRFGTYLHREVLSHCYYETGNYKLAERISKSFYMLADSFSSFEYEKKALELLIKNYQARNMHFEANKYLKELLIVQDSINELILEEKLLDLSAEHQLEKKEDEIKLLNAKNEVANLKFHNAKKNSFFSLVGALGLGLISLLMYKSLSQKKKSEKLLSAKNRAISSALSEKELLLKEIHHRVKNNLQVVSSLLSLQSEFIKDDSALSAINEGRNRVRSMALIHQNLYSGDNLTTITISDYFDKLISNLFNSYKIESDKIKLTQDIDEIELDVDTIVPLGLIANELISNALKHAFPDRKTGNIIIRFKEHGANRYMFSVSDDGVGMPAFDPNKEFNSFGFQMILAFVEKLKAHLEVNTDQGTDVKITFNVSKDA